MEIALQAQIGGGRALAAPLGLPGCVGLLLLAIGVHQEVARVIVEEDPVGVGAQNTITAQRQSEYRSSWCIDIVPLSLNGVYLCYII